MASPPPVSAVKFGDLHGIELSYVIHKMDAGLKGEVLESLSQGELLAGFFLATGRLPEDRLPTKDLVRLAFMSASEYARRGNNMLKTDPKVWRGIAHYLVSSGRAEDAGGAEVGGGPRVRHVI